MIPSVSLVWTGEGGGSGLSVPPPIIRRSVIILYILSQESMTLTYSIVRALDRPFPRCRWGCRGGSGGGDIRGMIIAILCKSSAVAFTVYYLGEAMNHRLKFRYRWCWVLRQIRAPVALYTRARNRM